MRSYLIIGKDEQESLGRFYSKNLQNRGDIVTLYDVRDSFPYLPLKVKNYCIDLVERGKLQLRIPEVIRRAQFDVIILTKDYLNVEVGNNCRAYWPGVKIVLINPDPIWSQGSQLFLLNNYDWLFFKDRLLVDRLKICNGLENISLLNEAYDDTHYLDDISTGENHVILLFGNLKNHRVHLINAVCNFIDITVCSPQYISRSNLLNVNKVRLLDGIYGRQKSEMIFNSFCVINDMNVSEANSFNAKFIEIVASGGFQLIPYSNYLSRNYPWMEAIMYQCPMDLVDRVNYFRSATEERTQILNKLRKLIIGQFSYDSNICKINSVLFENDSCT